MHRRLTLRNRIDSNIESVVSGRADLLYDALVAVIEHLVRAKTLDEVEVLRRCCSDDAEAAKLGELDRVLPDGRRTAPDEDGALGARPGVERRGQLERLVKALQSGEGSYAELRGLLERPAFGDWYDAAFRFRDDVFRVRSVCSGN
jgi:hypothetical protein